MSKLVSKNDGAEISVGDVAQTFRGESVKVLSYTPHMHSGSSGRIFVEFVENGRRQEFFPSVVGAEIIADPKSVRPCGCALCE